MRNLPGALALLTLLAAAPALAQQTGQPVAPAPAAAPATAPPAVSGAVDPNQVVDFDLAAGRFNDPLPFDVPFFVRGTRGPEVESITAKVLRFRDLTNCEVHQAEFETAPSLGPASLTAAIRQNGPLTFLLPVPPLRVNRYYCFQFIRRSRLSDTEQKKFQQRAAQAIDAALRQPYPDDTRRLEAYERLRSTLIASVNALLGPGQILDVPRDSFFKERTPVTEVKLDYRVEFDTILARQIQRNQAVQEFRNRQAGATNALIQLVGSDDYRRVVRGLQNGRASSLSLDEFLKGRPGALSLAGFDSSALEDIALGLEPGSVRPNLDETFASADLQALADHLAGTEAGLVDLREVIGTLNQNQVLRTAAGLDDEAGRQALARLPDIVEAARRAVHLDVATAQGFQRVLASRESLIQDLVGRLNALLQEILPIQGTTLAGFELRASWYISADVGLGLAEDIEEVFAYVGANVYFRPVNKKAHLRWASFREGFWDEFRKRFAVMIGLPYEELEEPGRLTGLMQNRPLVVGAGFRVNDLLRVTGGALVFKEDDPDPLVTGNRLATTPFFSLSVDWDVRSNFSKVFTALGGGTKTTP